MLHTTRYPSRASPDLYSQPSRSRKQAVIASVPSPKHTPQGTSPILGRSASENIPAVSSVTIPNYLRVPIPPPWRLPFLSLKVDSTNPPDSHSSYHAPSMAVDHKRHLTNQYRFIDPYDDDDDEYDLPPGFPYDTFSGMMCFVWEYLKGMQAMAINWTERPWRVRATT